MKKAELKHIQNVLEATFKMHTSITIIFKLTILEKEQCLSKTYINIRHWLCKCQQSFRSLSKVIVSLCFDWYLNLPSVSKLSLPTLFLSKPQEFHY
jgi:hypothetical protein